MCVYIYIYSSFLGGSGGGGGGAAGLGLKANGPCTPRKRTQFADFCSPKHTFSIAWQAAAQDFRGFSKIGFRV